MSTAAAMCQAEGQGRDKCGFGHAGVTTHAAHAKHTVCGGAGSDPVVARVQIPLASRATRNGSQHRPRSEQVDRAPFVI